MTRKNPPFDFEEALASLEELVTAMEDGGLSLEDSLKSFERGIKLTRECQGALEKAEQKVQLLLKEDGLPQAEPYDSDADDE
ncbi:MAG: exodeoxyribonuclease VII small subunit [Pseudomonadales bacterium]|nr:exodeoxyribonuclease VII small subunit [Pseudomonadales bacterium]